jgi:hypothetical protein
MAKLIAGRVSKRIIAKLCQLFVTTEKSENIRDEKLKKPDWLELDKSIFKDGTNANKDNNEVTEKIIVLLNTKRRSSL